MSHAWKRAARTFAQTAIGIFLALAVPSEAAGIPTYDVLHSAVLAAGWGGFVAVLAWAHNALEDHGTIRPRLKE